MKKLMWILAISIFGFVSVRADTKPLSFVVAEAPLQDDKVEINESDLPQSVIDAIENDNEVRDLEIKKAYQVTKDNQVFYKIKFVDSEFGEEITKKYDTIGEEVEKYDKLKKEPIKF